MKCIRCGLIHGIKTEEIVAHCLAVKRFVYRDPQIGEGFRVVVNAHISEIEYVDRSEQEKLLVVNLHITEPVKPVPPIDPPGYLGTLGKGR